MYNVYNLPEDKVWCEVLRVVLERSGHSGLSGTTDMTIPFGHVYVYV